MARRIRNLRSVEECLWSAFANFDPQEPQYFWAVRECVERIKQVDRQPWREVTARKEHECTRGCQIKPGDNYFQYPTGSGGWGDHLQVCAGCMAMILYFQRAYNLPPHFYSHWNWELKEPVLIRDDDRV